jgi:SsrA-binding protein
MKQVNLKNKKASFEYTFIDEFIAGIKLKGTEMKNLHISEYKNASAEQHEPKRDRKLLLTKKELRKLESKTQEKGFTIVPYRVFINDRGLAKVVVVLAKGKKLYDKRNSLRDKDDERRIKKEIF